MLPNYDKEALDPVDGPEVHGESWVADVLVGHVEVSLVTPPEHKRSCRAGDGSMIAAMSLQLKPLNRSPPWMKRRV